MFGTYQRLGVSVFSSNIDVIRAAQSVLAEKMKRDPKVRANRHEFYRIMLHYHYRARELYNTATFGGDYFDN